MMINFRFCMFALLAVSMLAVLPAAETRQKKSTDISKPTRPIPVPPGVTLPSAKIPPGQQRYATFDGCCWQAPTTYQ